MSKRFTDSDKYKNPFFKSLPAAYKLFWDYLYHDCNHAGIWIVDFEVAQIRIGKDVLINQEDALKFFNNEEERVIILNHGSKWFIKPFIDFQYGKLNPENKVHLSILNILEKYNIKGLARGLQGAIYIYKDKDKDKDKDSYGILKNVSLSKEEFDRLLNDYEEIIIKKYIESLSTYIPNKKGKPYSDHNAVIRAWLNKDDIPKKNENKTNDRLKVVGAEELK